MSFLKNYLFIIIICVVAVFASEYVGKVTISFMGYKFTTPFLVFLVVDIGAVLLLLYMVKILELIKDVLLYPFRKRR